MAVTQAREVAMVVSPLAPATNVFDSQSYTVRAETFSDIESPASIDRSPPQSRADFVQALRVLGRPQPGSDCHFDLGDPETATIQRAFLRCPLATWLNVFGHPESVREHRESALQFPVHIWKYRCTDGPVYCIGFHVDPVNGTRWVTFVRVCCI